MTQTSDMHKRGKCILWACVLAHASLCATEPLYHSKALSKWLELHEKAEPNGREETQAEEAVRAIGTNATPYLIEMLTNADLEVQGAGKNGFQILGPVAAPAVPALANLLDSTNQVQRFMAAQSLGYIGAPALPALIAGLKHQKYAVATDCALAIVELGTNAKPAIPILLRDLEHTNHFYRERAADALGKLHIEPETVVPALTRLLHDESNAARYLALLGLADFQSTARPAVPVISSFLTNQDKGFRSAATNAILKIAPEVLTNAPAQ